MSDLPKPNDPITILQGGKLRVTRVAGPDHFGPYVTAVNPSVLYTKAGSWWMYEEGIVWARGHATPEIADALRAAQALLKNP